MKTKLKNICELATKKSRTKVRFIFSFTEKDSFLWFDAKKKYDIKYYGIVKAGYDCNNIIIKNANSNTISVELPNVRILDAYIDGEPEINGKEKNIFAKEKTDDANIMNSIFKSYLKKQALENMILQEAKDNWVKEIKRIFKDAASENMKIKFYDKDKSPDELEESEKKKLVKEIKEIKKRENVQIEEK